MNLGYSNYYVLDGKEPVPEPDFRKFGDWFEAADRSVDMTIIDSDEFISTVFLGINHNFTGEGAPILFETMVFGGKYDGEQRRYVTWDEAERGHKETVAMVMGARGRGG